MNRFSAFAAVSAVAIALLSTPLHAQDADQPVDRPAVDAIIAEWPETPQEVAGTVMDKYGPPDEATSTRLVWHENGPWKRTILYREVVEHDFPMPHEDVLEQFINYRVPTDFFDELAAYDGSVIVERTKGEISARCDKELANFLALNLANDIVTGQRTVEEARAFYGETIQAVMDGESPPYTEGFQFDLPEGDTSDPDRAILAADAGEDTSSDAVH